MSEGTRPLILGHSHAGALFGAAAAKGIAFDAVSLYVEADALRHDGDRVVLSASLRERVQSASRVVSAVGGEAYLLAAFLTRARPFTFIPPWNPTHLPEAGVEVVPTKAVMELFRNQCAVRDAELRAIATAARSPVVHVSAPPPLRVWQGARARENLQALAARFGSAVVDQLETEASHRRILALWRAAFEHAKETCRALSIVLMAPPARACDDEGYLLPADSDDLVHANAAYGELVLEQLGIDAEGARQ